MPAKLSDHSAASLIAVAAVLLGISIITVILRFYARRRQKAALLADDWLTLPGLAAFAGACGALWLAVSIKTLGYSTGEYSKKYVQEVAERSARSQYALIILSTICLSCTKATVLLFYKRIFCISGRKATLRIILMVSVVVQFLWMATFSFLIGFECRTHFDAQWTGSQVKYCALSYPIIASQAISGFLLDVWVLILPICPISSLQTTKTIKFVIITIFFLACLGLGSSIARMVIFIRLFKLGVTAVHNVNPQQYQSRAVFYCIMEMGMSVICINLPSIWMLVASKPVDAVLRSVRSAVSLVSIGSKGSKSKKLCDRSNTEHLKPTILDAPFAGTPAQVGACESSDLEWQPGMPADRIRVSRSARVAQSTV